MTTTTNKHLKRIIQPKPFPDHSTQPHVSFVCRMLCLRVGSSQNRDYCGSITCSRDSGKISQRWNNGRPIFCRAGRRLLLSFVVPRHHQPTALGESATLTDLVLLHASYNVTDQVIMVQYVSNDQIHVVNTGPGLVVMVGNCYDAARRLC
jgi:hypothetical protein